MSFLHEAITKASDRLSGWLDSITAHEASAADAREADAKEIVRWLGGPFDGLETEVDSAAVWYLRSALEIPVCRATLESSPLEVPPPGDPPTSLALYGLGQEDGDWVYRFEAQVAAR